MKTRNRLHRTALAIAIASATMLTNAQDVRLYQSHVLPEALVFEPTSTIGMNSDIDIIIKGPDDLVIRQSFQAGEPIEFKPSEMVDGGLPDGTYRYQLQIADLKGVSAQRGPGGSSDTVQNIPQPGFGTFSILNGRLVSPETQEPAYAGANTGTSGTTVSKPLADDSDQQTRDQVIADDQIVSGSLCVGFDCVNGENFGFDTMRMKENNTRIKFDDTSNSASFPNNDWQLTANDSANGGLNKFSIDNTSTGRVPFLIEGPAPSNSLYVDDAGNIGIGTSAPVVETHIVDGDSPTVRLQQDGSSGFQAQTWDLAGNETNFFVRDVTNGSRLPFKIRPGAATDSLVIDAQGDLAIGVANADTKLHVRGTSGTTQMTVEEASATISDRQMMTLKNSGGARIDFVNTSSGTTWRFATEHLSDDFIVTKTGTGTVEMRITNSGDMTIAGTLTQGSSRTIKTAIQSIDGMALVEKLLSLDFSEWSYKKAPHSRHFGPMAEDFYEVFKFGSNDKHIAPGDMAGIAMAASKELALQNRELRNKVAELEARLERLDGIDGELKRLATKLEEMQSDTRSQ